MLTNDELTLHASVSLDSHKHRRERNRMHAKMTRDRKKNFIANIERTIGDLEATNQLMKDTLSEVIQTHFNGSTTVSPLLLPGRVEITTSEDGDSDDAPSLVSIGSPEHSPSQPPKKRKKIYSHGFSLIAG